MTENNTELKPYMSLAAVLAFSVGTSIGWGSFVITSSNYLSRAGLAGSVLGVIVGALVMLSISCNYEYLIKKFPSAGGVFEYSARILGYDYAFLASWFLGLTYITIFWANATSIPLFVRMFFKDFLCIGPHYSIFGYDVFVLESLLSVAAILLTGLLCSKAHKIAAYLMIALVSLFSIGILLVLFMVIFKAGEHPVYCEPAFLADSNAVMQILKIAFISPWAFIGFESVSHSSEEFAFASSKIKGVLKFAILITVILYVALIILSVSAWPLEYDSWFSYIRDINSLSGIKAVPVFYAASCRAGSFGVVVLILVLFSLILTSLIGNLTALSRFVYALSREEVIKKSFSSLNKKNVPYKAIYLVVMLSVFVPFFGRTAVGWIVDVTTIGATIIYGFLSYMTFKDAKKSGDKVEIVTGLIGAVVIFVFGFFMIVSDMFSGNSITSETYFLFCVWSILGFGVFHKILKNDLSSRFGKSVVVWVVLLSLVLFLSFVWMIQADRNAAEKGLVTIHDYVHELLGTKEHVPGGEQYLTMALNEIFKRNIQSSFIVIVIFAFSTAMFMVNFFIMRKRDCEREIELGKARQIANTDPLTGVKSKHAYVEYELAQDFLIKSGELKEIAVVVCDVNNLKTVNDTLGHKAGDEYIYSASRLICATFKYSPVFRTGGDEFVAVLKGEDFENRRKLINEINGISSKNNIEGGAVVAVGMSEFDSSIDEKLINAFERADAIMYERKRSLKEAAKQKNAHL